MDAITSQTYQQTIYYSLNLAEQIVLQLTVEWKLLEYLDDILEIIEEAQDEEMTKIVKFPCKNWTEFINILHQAMSCRSSRRPYYCQILEITIKI